VISEDGTLKLRSRNGAGIAVAVHVTPPFVDLAKRTLGRLPLSPPNSPTAAHLEAEAQVA